MHQRSLSGASPSTRTLQLSCLPILTVRTILTGRLRSLADCNIVCLRIRGKLIVLVFLILLNYLSRPLSVFSLLVLTLDEAFRERDSEAFHDTTRAAEPLIIIAKVVYLVRFFIKPTFDFPVPLPCHGMLSAFCCVDLLSSYGQPHGF